MQYLKFKKAAKEIYKWINETKQFLSHKIKVTEAAIIYIRDSELYTYNFKEIKKTYRTNNYFFLNTITNDDILLPIKSFTLGEYEQFLKVFDSNKEKVV